MNIVCKLLDIEIEGTICEVSSGNHVMCLLLEITANFRDTDIQIFLNGDVLFSVS